MASPKVISGFLCDEVRREANGKMFAIGVYGSRIYVHGFPSAIGLTGMINVLFSELGDQQFKVRAMVGGILKSEVTVAVSPNWIGSDWLPIPFGPLSVEGETDIRLDWLMPNGKWRYFASVPVEQDPNVPPLTI